MSLTKIQQPYSSLYANDKKLHGIYDTFYTASSSIYTDADFKFKFLFYNQDGNTFSTRSFPLISGYGAFNVGEYIKTYLTHTFQPTITTFTTCSNDIKQYQILVQEDKLGVISDSEYYGKAAAIKCYDEDFNYKSFLMKGSSSRFLTDMDEFYFDDYTNDRMTIRFLNGSFYSAYNSNYFSNGYRMNIWTYSNDGVLKKYYINNPYYNTAYNGWTSGDGVVSDIGAWLLEIPVGPKNLNSALKYFYYNGDNPDLEKDIDPPTLSIGNTIIDDNIAYYDIFLSYGNIWSGTQTSEKFRVYRKCNYTDYDTCMLAWENKYGATDYWIADLYNEKEYLIEKSTYYKDNKTITSGSYSNIPYSGGYETYNLNYNTRIIINTDFMTETQSNNFSKVFLSENVYLRYNNTWYKTIIDVENIVVKNEQLNNTAQYTIPCLISNKKLAI